MKTLKVLLQEVVSGIKAWVNSNFAQESNTVHKTGNETVNGVKTFTSTSYYNDVNPYCKNTSISGKLTPEVTSSIQTVTVGNSNMWYGNQAYILDANGECYWRWNAGSFRSSDQGQGIWGFDFGVKRDFSKVFLRPQFNNAYWLGESDHQWLKTYTNQLYINGVQFSPLIKNYWKEDQKIQATATIDLTTNPETEVTGHMLYFGDVARFWSGISPAWETDGSFRMDFGISNFKANGDQGYWKICTKVPKDFSSLAFYTTHGASSLGTSTNKWRYVNGINPGALSLPDFSADYDVSGEIVPPEGENAININGGNNTFTPTVSGWLSVRMHYAELIKIYRSTRSSYCFRASNNSVDDICVCSPVVAGVTYVIKIWASKWDDSGNNYDHFRLAPCLGNV